MSNETNWPKSIGGLLPLAARNNPDFIPIQKSGRNPACGGVDGDPEDIWSVGGTRGLPTSAGSFSVVSSSSKDSANGTGARTIRVYYLDSNYDPQYEDIIMNGTNTVASTTSDALRIRALVTLTAGSQKRNVGNIDCYIGFPLQQRMENSSDSSVRNRSLGTQFTVPNGYHLMIVSITLIAERGSTFSVTTEINDPSGTGLWTSILDTDVAEGTSSFDNFVPLLIPGKADARVVAKDLTEQNSSISCTYSGFLIKNSKVGSVDVTQGW